MNPAWIVRTGRLVMTPISYGDKADVQGIKADPMVFAMMLGGVRSPRQASDELADEMAFWARRGFGIWTVRGRERGEFLGLTGLMERADGRGIALRFAFTLDARGRGLAREAAGAALRFAHERAGLERIVAVAKETNFDSRTVLGGIGMVECDTFMRDGERMLVYESLHPDVRRARSEAHGRMTRLV